MKAFIVLAALVAVAAGQYTFPSTWGMGRVGYGYGRGLERSLENEVLLKEKMGLLHPRSMWALDMTRTPIREMTRQVVSVEEVISHPLFEQYMRLPLFRQFWEEHPIVAQKYVTSALFQRFWMIPSFQMYFRNPVLFYKFVVPQIHLVAETHGLPFVPSASFGERIHKYSVIDQIMNKRPFVPYMLNKEWNTPIEMTREYPETYHKYLLEKMMKHMLVEEVGTKGETETEIRVLPTGQIKEQTLGKFYNPITGEQKVVSGDIRTVEEHIIPRTRVHVPLEMQMSPVYKNWIAKKYFEDKVYGAQPWEMINTHYTPLSYNYQRYNPLVSRIFGVPSVYNKYTTSTPFVNTHYNTIFNTPLYHHQQFTTPFAPIYNNEIPREVIVA